MTSCPIRFILYRLASDLSKEGSTAITSMGKPDFRVCLIKMNRQFLLPSYRTLTVTRPRKRHTMAQQKQFSDLPRMLCPQSWLVFGALRKIFIGSVLEAKKGYQQYLSMPKANPAILASNCYSIWDLKPYYLGPIYPYIVPIHPYIVPYNPFKRELEFPGSDRLYLRHAQFNKAQL